MSEYCLIPLTQGQVAKVSPEDYDRLMQWKWYAQWDARAKSFKAVRGCSKRVLMHRDILGLTDPSVEVDHEDHDTLNNQRYNLRCATRSQNCMNRRTHASNALGIKGVRKVHGADRYMARIMVQGKSVYLGTFITPEAAAQAYRDKAGELHGEFAHA